MPSGFLRRRSASRGVSIDDGEDRGPALGRGELAAVVAAFGPRDPKAFRRGANDAGDLDRDLRVSELGKGIVGSRIIVQRRCSSISREVIGTEPILPQHDGVGRQTSHIFDEAREMKRDLRIGRLIEGTCWRDRLGLTEMINLHHPGCDRALA